MPLESSGRLDCGAASVLGNAVKIALRVEDAAAY